MGARSCHFCGKWGHMGGVTDTARCSGCGLGYLFARRPGATACLACGSTVRLLNADDAKICPAWIRTATPNSADGARRG